VCAEASTVLKAAAEDFLFNCWYLEIPSGNHIRHVSCARLSIGNLLVFVILVFKVQFVSLPNATTGFDPITYIGTLLSTLLSYMPLYTIFYTIC
jgi:hypothetical protein